MMVPSMRSAISYGLLLCSYGKHWADAKSACATGSKAKPTTKPNVIVVMSDDQDMHLNSLDYMPNVQKHFAQEGSWFKRHYCTVSQCCPSRISLWTGKAAHNTNVTDVVLPYGGYQQFARNGRNDNYLPIWLQSAGYNTYYVGKFINDHSTETSDKPYANVLIGPQIYNYYNASFVRNRDTPKFYPGRYNTDLVAEKAMGFLLDALNAGQPFFLTVAPIGPHTHAEEVDVGGPPVWTNPQPAKRHEHLFQDVKIPRRPSFNAARTRGVNYYKDRKALNQTEIKYSDEMYRDRLRALQAVDDMVGELMERLEKVLDVLANTYIIYTSDNGFHMGQHRLAPGKICNVEEDINIPFFIRGPGVPKGEVQTLPTTHTDVVPTIFHLAGLDLHDDFDGHPMPITKTMAWEAHRSSSEHVNMEFWGAGIVGEGPIFPISGRNNTYKMIRVTSEDYDLAYTVWCTNEHELYDLKVDPYQMTNIYATDCETNGWACERVSSRLDALLLTTKACKGKQCYRPWETLHPDGSVQILREAMNPKYDTFYEVEQPKVSFTACKSGYLAEFEGVMSPLSYEEQDDIFARWAERA